MFVKVDGPEHNDISSFLQIGSYPSFVMWMPNSHGGGVIYNGARSYNAMKDWIVVGCNSAGFKPKEGGPIKGPAQPNEVKKDAKD